MIKFQSVKGYYCLDAWIMANVIQLATYDFCQRFLTRDIDPCGRMFDQMTMAARSATANIAEGTSRKQTSRETEMKLTDVARASISELLGDYFFLAMANHIPIWSKTSRESQYVQQIKLDRPQYTSDWQAEAATHILNQKSKFDKAIKHNDISVVINSMIILCNREISLVGQLLKSQLEKFKSEGGFAENLTKERISKLKTDAISSSAPTCPKCGKPMLKRMAKRGPNSGHPFWSCSDYPDCSGSLAFKE